MADVAAGDVFLNGLVGFPLPITVPGDALTNACSLLLQMFARRNVRQ
ncbi:hypothetical protein [Candidatus Pantoea formicae]